MTNPTYGAHDDRSFTERCLELDTYAVQKAKGERYQADCKAYVLAKARDDDYNLFDDKLTTRIPKMSISLSDNITNHSGTQK